MIRLIMFFSLIGTVILIGICLPFSQITQTTIRPNTADITLSSADTQYKTEELHMSEGTVKDMFRREIVGKSIQILRSHGKADEEIREMMLNDFSISETVLDELLNIQVQNR